MLITRCSWLGYGRTRNLIHSGADGKKETFGSFLTIPLAKLMASCSTRALLYCELFSWSWQPLVSWYHLRQYCCPAGTASASWLRRFITLFSKCRVWGALLGSSKPPSWLTLSGHQGKRSGSHLHLEEQEPWEEVQDFQKVPGSREEGVKQERATLPTPKPSKGIPLLTLSLTPTPALAGQPRMRPQETKGGVPFLEKPVP